MQITAYISLFLGFNLHSTTAALYIAYIICKSWQSVPLNSLNNKQQKPITPVCSII